MLTTAFGDATIPFPKANEPVPTMAQRLYWLARAEIALYEKRGADALTIADQLLATAGQRDPSPAQAVPCLLKLRGDALLTLQRHDEAEEVLLLARQAVSLQGARSLARYIHQTLGQLYKVRGDRNKADTHPPARTQTKR